MNKLFLAIELSSLTRRTLAEWLEKPRERLDRQGMRWVAPDKLHVALLTLGDLDPTQVSELVDPIVRAVSPLELSLGKVTGFPDNKRPGVLALEVLGSEPELSALHSQLHTALLGESEEPFSAHIVLSRMKPASTKLGHKLRDYIHSGKHPEEATWNAEGVTLFNTNPDGSFEVIQKFAFGG